MRNENNPTDVLLAAAAARELGVSPSTLQVWVRLGKIKATATTNGWRLYTRAEVERVKKLREAKARASR